MRTLLLLPLLAAPLAAQAPTPATTSIAAATASLDKRDGYFPIYWDEGHGRVLLEIPAGRLGQDFLFLPSLATGIGDAGTGLGVDRGTIGDGQLARFERVGPKVQLVLQNPQFRASGTNEALARSVRESFPLSTVAAFDILAAEGGRVLVDVTPYLLSDINDLRGALRAQGSFQLDRDKSAVYLPHTKAFPRNTELEASLTFTSDQPGFAIRTHAPDGRFVTLRQHLSLVQLPDSGYQPRKFDPRIGLFAVSFYDFAKPFDQDYVTRYAIRHRLIKQDPAAAVSEPVQPIVYYLDAG
ncbi:MAG TPA: DUF5117 domain-containing protein, partial [Gemmatimonadales bacterium]|nr:DUF5117 domain-containing protein [Gemmatimonadales bacterium]